MTGPQATTQHHGLGRSKQRRRRSRVVAATIASTCLAAGVLASQAGSPAVAHSRHHSAFMQRNLVSDLPGRAELRDNNVKNPWGIAFGPTTPIWVNNNFNPASDCGSQDCIPAPETLLTKVTLYRGATRADDRVVKVPLEVTASAPTGMVFNPTSRFLIDQGNGEGPVPALFMFNETVPNATGDGPEGRITGWSPATAPPNPTTTTSTAARKNGGFPQGLALVPGGDGRGPRLLVVGNPDGGVAIYNSRFHELAPRGRFVDPHAADQGMAAYNVMYLKGRVYVTYTDFVKKSAVSVFRPDGTFRKRLFTNGARGPLVAPWGLAIAPDDWGRFGGDLLVGNVDNGKINAFDRHDGDFEGTLRDGHGDPIVNIGLWGIAFGNGVIGTPRTLLFSAGIGSGPDGAPGPDGNDTYAHGLVGLIQPVGHDDDD
jgi:uncharacterized protein (TIGR03118 family)